MTIRQSAAASRLDSFLYAYDENGKLLAQNDDISFVNWDSQVSIGVSAGGTYYVKAAAYGRSTGAYTLQFSTVADPPSPTPAATPPSSACCETRVRPPPKPNPRCSKQWAMKLIRSADLSFLPAGHEDPNSPGVWKKVLFQKADLQAGRVQMVNWARLPVGSAFAPHYHEDMQEFFVIVQGTAEITVGAQTAMLGRGDALLIDAREVHVMCNVGEQDVEYLAVGISSGQDGKTVVVA
jgi:mannose-6-phosphate isomerase-like protein (cupin superfamily)